MQKNKKIVILIISIMLMTCVLQSITYADNFNPKDYDPSIGDDPLGNKTREIIGKVLGVVTAFGSVAAIAFLIIIGIRFVLGSVEEKAQYKESLKPYLIGAILLFAISRIVDALYNIGTGFIE